MDPWIDPPSPSHTARMHAPMQEGTKTRPCPAHHASRSTLSCSCERHLTQLCTSCKHSCLSLPFMTVNDGESTMSLRGTRTAQAIEKAGSPSTTVGTPSRLKPLLVAAAAMASI